VLGSDSSVVSEPRSSAKPETPMRSRSSTGHRNESAIEKPPWSNWPALGLSTANVRPTSAISSGLGIAPAGAAATAMSTAASAVASRRIRRRGS
jgi:hypothetical protein